MMGKLPDGGRVARHLACQLSPRSIGFAVRMGQLLVFGTVVSYGFPQYQFATIIRWGIEAGIPAGMRHRKEASWQTHFLKRVWITVSNYLSSRSREYKVPRSRSWFLEASPMIQRTRLGQRTCCAIWFLAELVIGINGN